MAEPKAPRAASSAPAVQPLPAGLKGPPLVSIVVPCRNERSHIRASLRSILQQREPDGGLEVIVADGLSEDGTREIILEMALRDGRLRLIDNPGLSTPCALNAGIRAAEGEYVAILGAHTEYAPDYVFRCVEVLQSRPEVACSGGPILSRGRSRFGQAVAAAMSHPVGIGNARHRYPGYEGYAEGACFPVFRREVFEKVGLYDENLVRNQDDELNYRLALQGEKVYLTPLARCEYFVRESPRRLFQQYFQYGFYRLAVLRKHGQPASLRQMVPVLFFPVLLLSWLVPVFYRPPGAAVFALPTVAYVACLLAAALQVGWRREWKLSLRFAAAAALMHVAYCAGFWWAFLKGLGKSGVRSQKSGVGSQNR